MLKRLLEAPTEDVDKVTQKTHERVKMIAKIANLVQNGGKIDLGSGNGNGNGNEIECEENS